MECRKLGGASSFPSMAGSDWCRSELKSLRLPGNENTSSRHEATGRSVGVHSGLLRPRIDGWRDLRCRRPTMEVHVFSVKYLFHFIPSRFEVTFSLVAGLHSGHFKNSTLP